MNGNKETLYEGEYALRTNLQVAHEVKRAIQAVKERTGRRYPARDVRGVIRYEVSRHTQFQSRPVRITAGIITDKQRKIMEWIDVTHDGETPREAITSILAPLRDPRRRPQLYEYDTSRLFREVKRLFFGKT